MFSKERHHFGQGVLVPNSSELGLWVFLATVSMLFAAFISAYLVRKTGSDWHTGTLPDLLWINTVVLILSSITLEISRIVQKKSSTTAWKAWFLISAILGFLFLGGQFQAWEELMELGYYIPTNPHSSFLYILTGMHALHLFSGLLLLVYAYRKISINRTFDESTQNGWVRLCATYWHFLVLLWIFLFAVLSF